MTNAFPQGSTRAELSEEGSFVEFVFESFPAINEDDRNLIVELDPQSRISVNIHLAVSESGLAV